MPNHDQDDYAMSEDDNKPRAPPDSRYEQWDARSRTELRQRLYEAVTKRCEATQRLIPTAMKRLLPHLGITLDDESVLKYKVSHSPVIEKTHESINRQIADWKGLRWWRFSGNACDSWSKWFKKAKCWQDQNQHKPLGKLWSLVFDELKQYALNIAQKVYPESAKKRQRAALHRCLYTKCVETILRGMVRFDKTRPTPLLPVRALDQSKELQKKLQSIDSGFMLTTWKRHAENNAKSKKRKDDSRSNGKKAANKTRRANVATILNDKCEKYASTVFRHSLRCLKETIPTLKIDFTAIDELMKTEALNAGRVHKPSYPESSWDNHEDAKTVKQENSSSPSIAAPTLNVNTAQNAVSGYGAIRGMNDTLRAKSHRYAPTVSSERSSDTSSLSDTASIGNHSNTLQSVRDRDRARTPPRQQHSSRHSAAPLRAVQPVTNTNTESEESKLLAENENLRKQLAEMQREFVDKIGRTLEEMQHQREFFHTYMMKNGQPVYAPYPVAMPAQPPLPPIAAAHATYPAGPPPAVSSAATARSTHSAVSLPSTITFNDGHGGHGIYNPPHGTMFHFPSSEYLHRNHDENQSNQQPQQPPTRNTVDIEQIVNHRHMNMNIDMVPPHASPVAASNPNTNASATAITSQPGTIPSTECVCDSMYELSPNACSPQISGVSFSSLDTDTVNLNSEAFENQTIPPFPTEFDNTSMWPFKP